VISLALCHAADASGRIAANKCGTDAVPRCDPNTRKSWPRSSAGASSSAEAPSVSTRAGVSQGVSRVRRRDAYSRRPLPPRSLAKYMISPSTDTSGSSSFCGLDSSATSVLGPHGSVASVRRLTQMSLSPPVGDAK